MLQEFREQKEKEIAELTAIKGDLEVRLQRALQVVDEDGDLVDGGAHFMGQLCYGLHLAVQVIVYIYTLWMHK